MDYSLPAFDPIVQEMASMIFVVDFALVVLFL